MEKIMDYEPLLSIIKQRRSIRRYEPDPVPMEDVMRVLEAARWAPSGDNSQPWEFIVIRDPEKLNMVMDILIESAKQCRESCPRFTFIHPERLREATTLILVCADPRFKTAYPRSEEGHESAGMYEENSGRILIESVTYAITYINLAAVSLRLGTVFWSSPGESNTAERLRDALNIPDTLEPICCLPLGYPSHLRQIGISPKERTPRPLDSMVHLDGFDKSKWRSDEDVVKHTRVGRKVWAEFYRTGDME